MKSELSIFAKAMLAVLILGSGSCIKIYGLKRVRTYTPDQTKQWNAVHGISGNAILGQDYELQLSKNFNDKNLKKDLQQPLQYWIFDSGNLLSNMVNCNATGFPNLKWPIEENFRNKTINAEIRDEDFYTKFLHVQRIDPAENTRIMVINYARFMGRQNKRFLKNCRSFLAANPDFRPYYNNMDNTFSSSGEK